MGGAFQSKHSSASKLPQVMLPPHNIAPGEHSETQAKVGMHAPTLQLSLTPQGVPATHSRHAVPVTD
jgi:hypothetical protein